MILKHTSRFVDHDSIRRQTTHQKTPRDDYKGPYHRQYKTLFKRQKLAREQMLFHKVK